MNEHNHKKADRGNTTNKPEQNGTENKRTMLIMTVVLVLAAAAVTAGIIFLIVKSTRMNETPKNQPAQTTADTASGTAPSTNVATTAADASNAGTAATASTAEIPAETNAPQTAPDPILIDDSLVAPTAETMLEIADTNPAKLPDDDAYQTGADDFKYYYKHDDGTGNDAVFLSQITDVYEKNGEKYCTQIDYLIYTEDAAYQAAKKAFEGDDSFIWYDDKRCVAQIISDIYYDTSVGNAGMGTRID